MIFSSAPIWPGERSLSKMTTSAFSLRASSAISCLAAADVGAGVDFSAVLEDLADDVRTGGLGETAELAQRIARVGGGFGQDHADEDRLLLLDGQFGSFQFRHRGGSPRRHEVTK